MDPERDNLREMTRAEQRRRLAAAEKFAMRLIARGRYPDVCFRSDHVAEAVGRIEYYGHPLTSLRTPTHEGDPMLKTATAVLLTTPLLLGPVAVRADTMTDGLPLTETLSYQIFHNGVPAGGETVITPQIQIESAPQHPITPVPEPSTLVLGATGAGLLAAYAAWRRRQ
jgi:MYXO-CTERM domain-containing protein